MYRVPAAQSTWPSRPAKSVGFTTKKTSDNTTRSKHHIGVDLALVEVLNLGECWERTHCSMVLCEHLQYNKGELQVTEVYFGTCCRWHPTRRDTYSELSQLARILAVHSKAGVKALVRDWHSLWPEIIGPCVRAVLEEYYQRMRRSRLRWGKQTFLTNALPLSFQSSIAENIIVIT